MHTIKASEFKAKCLKLMDEVARTGQPIRITKNGVPVAEIVPSGTGAADNALFGADTGRIEILGDIMSPAVPAEDWDALR